jgi:hypothetical protein
MRKLAFLFILLLPIFAFAQSGKILNAANGLSVEINGTDGNRNADQIWLYTIAYYKSNPPSNTGIDVYVVDNKVVEIADRAGAVFLQNKPDPGAIKVGKDGFVISGNGAGRRWILANLKVGDVVSIGNKGEPKGEVAPAKSIPCFEGAYYRKAVTSFDVWTGIAGMIKLGTPKFDESRLRENDKNQYLDNFSVYMGGNAGGNYEVDAGLSWEFTVDEKGNKSAKRNAFRPFWRTKTWTTAPAQKEFYFYPGETVQMAILVAGPKKLRLIISDGKTKTFQTEFEAEGFAANVPRQFKRVNAIDQFGNEGKAVSPTTAEITGAEWLQTVIFRGDGANAKQIPMTAEKFTDMRCPNEKNIVVTLTEKTKGGEKIDLFGTPR